MMSLKMPDGYKLVWVVAYIRDDGCYDYIQEPKKDAREIEAGMPEYAKAMQIYVPVDA